MNTPSAGLGRGKRKGRTATGDDKKGEQYWERRRKNNIAAKRSRDSRRAKDNQVHRTLTPLFFMLPLISNEYFNAYPTSMRVPCFWNCREKKDTVSCSVLRSCARTPSRTTIACIVPKIGSPSPLIPIPLMSVTLLVTSRPQCKQPSWRGRTEC